MKTFVSILLLVSTLLLCVSCDSSAATPIESTTSSNRYEVDLNLSNYNTYLAYTAKGGTDPDGRLYKDNYVHTISGVLTYAFYENVVITFEVKYRDPKDEDSLKTKTHTVTLNAAGNAEFNMENILSPYWRYDASIYIVSVSGRVIFII